MNLPSSCFFALTLCASSLLTHAGDWPQWRGPDRSDVSAETGLLKSWPTGGPRLEWLYKDAGKGYAGFSVAKGVLYTMGTREEREMVVAVDAVKGTELWHAAIDDIFGNKWGDGPRCTPAVDGDKVYALSGKGTLVCLSAKDGKQIWSRTMGEMGGKTPGWGFTESVLVTTDHVVCTPGGPQGTMAALNKDTGATIWQSKDWTDPAQYSSIVPAVIHGVPQYVQLTMQSIAGIAIGDGKVVWRADWPGRTAVIPTPIIRDDRVFITSGYGVGCKSLTIAKDWTTTENFRSNDLENHHGGVVLVGDYLYGHSKSGWTCLDWRTGAVKWQEKRAVGKGAITAADGRLYLLDEKTGAVVLIEASPEAFKEISRFTLQPQTQMRSPQGAIWVHPVIANGRMYLRDQEYVHCFAIKAP